MKIIPHQLKERLARPLRELPHPSDGSLELAFDFANLAIGDVASAKSNYKGRRFANAARDLQQSVEKGAKAFGLLIGTVEPTSEQLKSKDGVYHYAYRAFTLNFGSFYQKLNNLMDALREVTQALEANPFIPKVISKRSALLINRLEGAIPSKEKINTDIQELFNLDEEEM